MGGWALTKLIFHISSQLELSLLHILFFMTGLLIIQIPYLKLKLNCGLYYDPTYDSSKSFIVILHVSGGYQHPID